MEKKIEIERDCDLRGYWIHGIAKINDYCRRHTFGVEDAIFISDKAVGVLEEVRKNERASGRIIDG